MTQRKASTIKRPVCAITFALLTLCIVASANVASAQQTSLEQRMDAQEERLDEIERRSMLDRIMFSAEYRTIFNAFIYSGPSSSSRDLSVPSDPFSPRKNIDQTTEEVWSHRLRLKMKAEPISSLRLTARLVFFKNFGDGDAAPFIPDFQASRMPRDSALRVDQLWIDWFITEWLALSAGRIAFAEGNPNELRENSTIRRATWGLHMVDGEYEAFNLTANLSEVLEGWFIRAFYASWFNDNDNDVFGAFGFLDDGTDNLRLLGGNMDLIIPNAGNNFVQIGYFLVPQFRPFVLPIPDPAFDAEADFTHAPAPLNTELLFPSNSPDSLGWYHSLSALIEFYDFFGSGFDWFVSGSIGWLNPNGRGVEYDLPLPNSERFSQADTPRASTPFLFLASEGDSGTTYFFYGGIRYTIPALTLPKLGFEFNYGSRYHISFATPTDHLFTKLAVRGKAYEGYLIVPVNNNIYLRGSYVLIDNDYSTGFFGPNPGLMGTTAPPFEQTIHNFQVVLNTSF